MKVLHENYPYRMCESDTKDSGWIEKYNWVTKRYSRMYECDSPMQLLTAIEDPEYCKWLDPDRCTLLQEKQRGCCKEPL